MGSKAGQWSRVTNQPTWICDERYGVVEILEGEGGLLESPGESAINCKGQIHDAEPKYSRQDAKRTEIVTIAFLAPWREIHTPEPVIDPDRISD